MKKQNEHAEQVAVVQWARYSEATVPALKMLFSVPNGAFYGGDRRINAIRAKYLKAEGLKPGVPDLFLAVARGGLHGLFIEMKAGIKGRTTPEQRNWIMSLAEHGYRAVVCKGFEAAKQEIVEYLGAG